MWTQIRLLLQEQSNLGPHCLTKRLLKQFSRRQKQTTFVVIGVQRVNPIQTTPHEINPNQTAPSEDSDEITKEWVSLCLTSHQQLRSYRDRVTV